MLARFHGNSLTDSAAFQTLLRYITNPHSCLSSSLEGGLQVLKPLRTTQRERLQVTHSHCLSSLAPIPSGVLEGEMGSTSQQSPPAGAAHCLLVGYTESQHSPALVWER